MLTEYWIFILVWCFILGKLEECTSRNERIIDDTIIDLSFLQMHVFAKWGSVTHVSKGREPLSRKRNVWLKNSRYVWQSPVEMLFQNVTINAVSSERFIQKLRRWCSPGNLLKRLPWRSIKWCLHWMQIKSLATYARQQTLLRSWWELLPEKAIYKHLSVSKACFFPYFSRSCWPSIWSWG